MIQWIDFNPLQISFLESSLGKKSTDLLINFFAVFHFYNANNFEDYEELYEIIGSHRSHRKSHRRHRELKGVMGNHRNQKLFIEQTNTIES